MGSRWRRTLSAAADPSLPGAFRLPGTRPIGCLLIHGFTATPGEMRSLGDALSAAGFPVVAVRLAGHGTSVGDLARVRWRDWADSVNAGAEELAPDGGPLFVAGMSLGGLLALHFAATAAAGRVAGLVCCGVPLHLTDPRFTVLRWLYRLPLVRRLDLAIPKRGRDISDPMLRAASHSYASIPLAAVVELLALQDVVRGEVARVTTPTLILHGRHDHTAPFENAAQLAAALSSAPVESVAFERSWHVLTEDVEREAVAARVVAFLDRLSPTVPS